MEWELPSAMLVSIFEAIGRSSEAVISWPRKFIFKALGEQQYVVNAADAEGQVPQDEIHQVLQGVLRLAKSQG